ncbi:MAG TPA: ABC-type transport auxiliary lipoprotein family protein [Allosphingosinicella sp.]|nr:ABC-type transport auxiliary lipoprotein family protein [Allosphingosinicella sp.]
MRQKRSVLALAAALALSGCLSFGAKPPPSLMRLTPDARLTASSRTAPAGEALTVVPPSVPAELQTPRVPVRTGATQVAYVKGAQWVEAPNILFARLLSETIAARNGRVVLDPKQFTFDPGQRLTGTLQAFGLEADRMEAVLVYDAAVSRGKDAVETRRFEARVPVPALDAASAPGALNQAANQVAAEVAAWVG